MDANEWQAWAVHLVTGLAQADADLCLRWINPALAQSLALGPRSAVGRPLAWLLRDPEMLTLAQNALQQQRSMQWRGVPMTSADGVDFRADVALQPFEDGLLLEVHVLAEPLQTSSPLSATLRGFAHEVKNPLAGLRGAAQLLQRRLEATELQSLAAMIIQEADRLTVLANRLLHHDGAPRLATVNVHRLLERLVELLQAEPSPARLRHDYDPSVPDLYADADRLLQVLLNLARNAREAGAQNLTLRTRIEHGLRLGAHVQRMALRLDVMDDGAGVPPALRDTLFEPLTSGRADGSGLGLALSREIVHEHGGELRYASRPGETVFSLYLPLEGAP